jgi:hypothetical protein
MPSTPLAATEANTLEQSILASEPVDERTAHVPEPGALNLDHVAHFVPHIDEASDDLTRLGFTLTPFSPQSHRLEPDGPLLPAGTGNRCVMFEHGYLEFLTPTADTPLAAQLREAMSRYVGVHLIAFGTSSPDADYARLAESGFNPGAPVALQRPISTETGEDIARFTIVRVPPGTMAEGRIPYCQQQTPQLVWQPRWVRHVNGVTGLSSVIICVANAAEAADRYRRYTGLLPKASYGAQRIKTDRGTLIFVEPKRLESAFNVRAPCLPWIAGYVLRTNNVQPISRLAHTARADVTAIAQDRVLLRLSASLGGIAIIETPAAGALRFD